MHSSLFNARGGGTGPRARAFSLAAVFALLAVLLPATAAVVLANSGGVSGQETCSGWSATVSLDNNVQSTHLVTVTSTIPGYTTTGITFKSYNTTSASGSTTIWSASGTNQVSGTVTLIIYNPPPENGGNGSGGVENQYAVSITPATGCTPPTPSVTLTLVKAICPSYSDVPANRNPSNLDATGGHSGDLNSTAQTTLTGLSDIPAACHGAAGWYFNLGDGTSNAQNPPVSNTTFGTVGPTDANGQVSVTLTSAELARAMTTSGWQSGLLVSEVPQSNVASFGALRCFTDINNGDNLESIFGLDPAKTTQVYCIAFNVEPAGNLTITKSVSGAPTDWAGATFDFTATCSNPGDTYHASIAYPGATTATITGIPAGSSCTVSEDALPTPPTNYAWDTPQVSGSPVTIQSDKTAQVSVGNTLLPPGTIIVKKVVTNTYGGSTDPSQFSLYVKDATGTNVNGSPAN